MRITNVGTTSLHVIQVIVKRQVAIESPRCVHLDVIVTMDMDVVDVRKKSTSSIADVIMMPEVTNRYNKLAKEIMRYVSNIT